MNIPTRYGCTWYTRSGRMGLRSWFIHWGNAMKGDHGIERVISPAIGKSGTTGASSDEIRVSSGPRYKSGSSYRASPSARAGDDGSGDMWWICTCKICTFELENIPGIAFNESKPPDDPESESNSSSGPRYISSNGSEPCQINWLKSEKTKHTKGHPGLGGLIYIHWSKFSDRRVMKSDPRLRAHDIWWADALMNWLITDNVEVQHMAGDCRKLNHDQTNTNNQRIFNIVLQLYCFFETSFYW